MELRYPQIIRISIIIVVVLLLIIVIFKKIFRDKYSKGLKIANTHFIKNDKYYKYLKIKFVVLRGIADCFGLASIFIAIYLLARPYEIEKIEEKEYNRDIMLCMDISSSVNRLNSEVIESLKEIVKSLKGDKFGITVFSNSSVSIVPLTNDYNYVTERLETISDVLTLSSSAIKSVDEMEIYNAIVEANRTDNNRGMSLIGDGLASCVYGFTNLEEERSRVIIFSTDNALSGTPIVTLDVAADIAKSKDIKVFGIGTSNLNIQGSYYGVMAQNRAQFEKAVNKTGGKLFIQQIDSIDNAIKEIDNVSKSVDIKTIQKDYDIPEKAFMYLLINTSIYIVLSKKVQEW